MRRPSRKLLQLFRSLEDVEREQAEEAARAEAAAVELAAHDRMRIHEADLSPPDMSLQGCHALEQYIPRLRGLNIVDVIDPTAGSGSFPAAINEVWPHAMVLGCEARAEEQTHLEHHCDGVAMGDVFAAGLTPSSFDLAVTNPPFSLIPDLLALCMELVRPGGYIAFVVRMTWGDAAETDPLWHTPPVLWSLEFAGRWRFRIGLNPKTGKPYGVDSVGYRLLVWRRPDLREREGAGIIHMVKLPLLHADSRRWRKTAAGLWVKPGTEYLHEPGTLEQLPATPWRAAA